MIADALAELSDSAGMVSGHGVRAWCHCGGIKSATSENGEDVRERATGIEPALPAWKAGTLPLSYAREAPRG